MLKAEQKQFLLQLAKETIRAHLEKRDVSIKRPVDSIYRKKKGIFVTLHINRVLRGCIGYIRPYYALFESVKECALAAAFNDPRFRPLTIDEFEDIEIEISILSDLIPVDRKKLDEIVIGRDGVYINGSYGSSLFLPQVAVEQGWDLTTFLSQLSRKAGLPPKSYLSEMYNLFRFSAEVFSDADEKSIDS